MDGYCSGSVSVAFSTEAKAAVELPGTFSLRQGSKNVYSSKDVRNFLGRGGTIRFNDTKLHRYDGKNNNYHVHHSFQKTFNETFFELDRPFDADGLYPFAKYIRTRLPGEHTHMILPNTKIIKTSRDLRQYISRGDRIRIGAEHFIVASDLNQEFSSSRLPLNDIFRAYNRMVQKGQGSHVCPRK